MMHPKPHTGTARTGIPARGGITTVLLILAVTAALLAGCVTPPVAMDTPEGFAAFDDEESVRVISPDGVLLRARTAANDPEQSLEFWGQVLERQLLSSGYQLVRSEEFVASGVDGMLMEWLAPVSDSDWIYLTAISVLDDRIAIVEAAGPTAYYDERRSAIMESLSTLHLENSGS